MKHPHTDLLEHLIASTAQSPLKTGRNHKDLPFLFAFIKQICILCFVDLDLTPPVARIVFFFKGYERFNGYWD